MVTVATKSKIAYSTMVTRFTTSTGDHVQQHNSTQRRALRRSATRWHPQRHTVAPYDIVVGTTPLLQYSTALGNRMNNSAARLAEREFPLQSIHTTAQPNAASQQPSEAVTQPGDAVQQGGQPGDLQGTETRSGGIVHQGGTARPHCPSGQHCGATPDIMAA